MQTQIDHQQPPPPVSFHGFIFPFDCRSREHSSDVINRIGFLKQIRGYFDVPNSNWDIVDSASRITSLTDFNEYNYFYDFVRPALGHTPVSNTNDNLLLHFRCILKESPAFSIVVSNKSYLLRIASIEAKFFAPGMGTLSINVFNERDDQSSPEDIILINQYGRRLYPPFYSIPLKNAGNEAYFSYNDWSEGLKEHPEIATEIGISGISQGDFKTTFGEYRNAPSLDRCPPLINHLFPKMLTENMLISPALDDRMFTMCWYGNDEIVTALKDEKDGESPKYLSNDWWYRYIFVDGSSRTCQNPTMMKDLIRQHTYTRWTGWGTYWGIARYSWVALTPKDVPPFIVAHIRTIYLRMAELALVQRACVLRFADLATQIGAMQPGDHKLPQEMDRVFQSYMQFINQLQFREVTAQEQGIEMYDMLRRSMRLEEQIESLNKQIKELHSYASILSSNTQSDRLNLLTYIGSVLGIPSIISTMYSLMGYKTEEHPWWPVLIGTAASVVLAILFIKIQNRTWRNVFFVIWLIALGYTIGIIPLINK
jgi:hypothetical protein